MATQEKETICVRSTSAQQTRSRNHEQHRVTENHKKTCYLLHACLYSHTQQLNYWYRFPSTRTGVDYAANDMDHRATTSFCGREAPQGACCAGDTTLGTALPPPASVRTCLKQTLTRVGNARKKCLASPRNKSMPNVVHFRTFAQI